MQHCPERLALCDATRQQGASARAQMHGKGFTSAAACSEDSLAASNRELRWMGCTSADAGLSLPSTSITQCASAADTTYLVSRFRWHAAQDRAWRTRAFSAPQCESHCTQHTFFSVSRRYRRSVQQPLAPDQLQLRLPGLKDTRLYVDKLPYTGLYVRKPLRRFNPHRRPADPG
ncbi:hypothetical protein D0A36_20780 [Xanthomonas campestris]|nr:hypothetical protein D0A36_20780 [Xanthomonas campestris]RFF54289.1 hypothetical protein D0A41_17325 [Xanthomonas campestris]